MLIRRQKRGPPYGWTQLPWPALGQPGTLRPGILAGRRHPFSLVIHGPQTSAEYNKWDSSTLAVSDVDPRSAASNRWGTVFASLQRAPPRSSKSDCSTGPHTLGGPHHLQAFSPPHSEGYILSTASPPILLADLSLLQGFSLLYSQFPCLMFLHTVSFLGAYNICMHHTSMFCVCPPLTLFPAVFPSCVFLFSLLMCTPM
jgi:hypothetical protein